MAEAPDNVPVPGSKPTPQIAPGEQKTPQEPGGRPFSSYMKGGGEPNPLISAGKNPQVSPFDLAQGKVPTSGPTFVTMQEQAKQAQTTMGDVANQLNTPKLKLKQSTKYLLKNKLGSANGHIKSAAAKLGAKETKEEESKGAGPLQKFLNMVTSGQTQMASVQKQLAEISKKGQNMNPADMLQIQVKLNKAQQELEYSSLLLSKAVDDLKMMMNIQL